MRRLIVTAGSLLAASAVFIAIVATVTSSYAVAKTEQEWKIHDMSRPQPPIITPGEASTQDRPGRPPSDAIVLFDGKDLSQWEGAKGGPAKWQVENGYFEVVAKTGDIHTRQAFGDCQLHVEWASPDPPHGEDQDRGNSGVYLMSTYEIQVLDSYQNKTYADGHAAAVYGQYPPLVNAMRPPGQWQTYDIIFYAPVFKDGKLVSPARITMLHNGVLVHHNQEIYGPTGHRILAKYDKPIEPKRPLVLAGHNNPVRFRNIWIRPL